MLFIPLLILGILFYFSDKRVWSALIFFFFLTDGLHLVPPVLFETDMFVSKASDFAVLYVVFIFLLGIIKYKDFLVSNKLTKWIWIFMAFIIVSCCVSRFYYRVPVDEIIRTSRIFFFVLAYFVFRRFTKKELLMILKILFYVTTFQCILYILQSILGIPIMTGASTKGKLGTINRYYNIPYFYYFFLFYSFFFSPLKGIRKYVNILIFILVSVVSLHRGLMMSVCLLGFLGIYFQGGFKGTIKYLFLGAVIITPFAESIFSRFSDNTTKDINSVVEGAFQDYGEELSVDGTFLFRIALFYERLEYIKERPVAMIFGVGYMSEGSSTTVNTFDFKIGLIDSESREVAQLDTSDIAWVMFLLRLGFVGTFIYLYLLFLLAKGFYRNKKEPLSIIGLLYILLLLFNTLTSSIMYYIWLVVPVFFLYIIQEIKEKEDQACLENKTLL